MAVNQRKAGAILTYVQIILSNTISLVYTPIMLRMLGQSQYGIFGAASSITSYLNLLTLGIGGAYITWNAKYRATHDVEGEQRLNGMFFTMFTIISFVTFVVGIVMVLLSDVIFGNKFTGEELYCLKWVIFLYVSNIALTYFFTPITSNIIAYEKFIVSKIVAIANIIIVPIINIIVLCYGGKSIALAVVNVVFSLTNFIIYFIYARTRLNMKFIFRGFQFKVFRDIFIFSSFLMLNTITDIISNSTDGIILGAVSGTAALSVYTVGRSFQGYFQSFSVSVSGVFAPQVNLMVAEGKDNSVLDSLMLKIGRIQFYIASLILLGFLFIGRQFICLWAGEDYYLSYYVALILIVGTIIPLIQNVGIEIQKAKNKHKFRSVVYFLIALVNVGLTIPFTIWWNGIGAVLATFICCMLGQGLAMNIYYAKGIGLNMMGFWKNILKIVPSFIPTIILGICINIFIDIKSIWLILVFAILILVVFCASVWLFSMNSYEKDLVKRPLNKIINKFKTVKSR